MNIFPIVRFFRMFLFWISLAIFVLSCNQRTGVPLDPICSFDEKDYHQKFNGQRIVNFMVTADPQYNINDMEPLKDATINADSVSVLLTERICGQDYRGVIIAGDLTHHAKLKEFEKYQDFIKPFKPFTFDGLGNHDFTWLKEPPTDLKPYRDFGIPQISTHWEMKWEVQCLTIWDEVRDRKRIPDVNRSFPNIHYSWDWEDIHFVQLNVFPGDHVRKNKPAQNPFKALSFLKKDLEKHVGNSGRPVVLTHHYGLDDFSRGIDEETGTINQRGAWWTIKDRENYWNLLSQYNIIAIFSGHAHYCNRCYLPWDGVNIGEENINGEFIPTFVSGAAREGKYLECSITEDSLIVKRFYFEDLDFRISFPIDRK